MLGGGPRKAPGEAAPSQGSPTPGQRSLRASRFPSPSAHQGPAEPACVGMPACGAHAASLPRREPFRAGHCTAQWDAWVDFPKTRPRRKTGTSGCADGLDGPGIPQSANLANKCLEQLPALRQRELAGHVFPRPLRSPGQPCRGAHWSAARSTDLLIHSRMQAGKGGNPTG